MILKRATIIVNNWQLLCHYLNTSILLSLILLLTTSISNSNCENTHLSLTYRQYNEPATNFSEYIPNRGNCQKVNSPFCNLPSYETTLHNFTNSLGHTRIHDATAALHKYIYLLGHDKCREKIQLFLCSLYFPTCVKSPDGELLYPCKDDCVVAKEVCRPDFNNFNDEWPREWDCDKFRYYSEHKLCVVDNSRNSTSSATGLVTSAPPNTNHDDFSKFDESIGSPNVTNNDSDGCNDLFDCQLRGRSSITCIAQIYVCDGKQDCFANGTSEGIDGRDEKDCPTRCTENQLDCGDNVCIELSQKCNGLVECSSGIDEQDCDNRSQPIGLMQSIILIFMFFMFVAFLVGAIHHLAVGRYNEDNIEHHIKPGYEPPRTTLSRSEGVSDTIVSVVNHENSSRPSIYIDPPYSIDPRSNYYERVAIGGRSGASSVYNSYQSPPRSIIDIGRHSLTPQDCLTRPPQDEMPPPPPPPPTPAPTPAPLYANFVI